MGALILNLFNMVFFTVQHVQLVPQLNHIGVFANEREDSAGELFTGELD